MKKENSSVAVYMKIRRYMLNFVEQAGERSIQAPTILELSHRFGVSRPTVSKAMKMLTDDGYIIGRPGLGAFTNPAKVNRHQVQHYKNVGILIGDGMLINYSPFYAEQLGRILLGLARQKLMATSIQLTTHQKKQAVEEISMIPADVLLWIAPSVEMLDAIGELRAAGKRVIVVGTDLDQVADVYFDYDSFGYRMGKTLLAEGRRKVVYLLDTPAWSRPLTGMKRAFHEVGTVPDPELFISEARGMWEKLEKLLATPGRVDAVFSAVCPTGTFLPFYRQLPAQIQEKVLFIVEADYCPPDGFSGILFRVPFQKLADEVCSLIDEKLQGISTERKTTGIEIEFTKVEGGLEK